MTVYYCFEVSTDMRYGVLKMVKTRSKKIALGYSKRATRSTFPELATNDIPGYYQNHHVNIWEVYSHDGKLPIKEIKKEYETRRKHYRNSSYSRSVSLEAAINNYLCRYGTRI